jgi:glutamyl-tRNA reductase
VDREVGQFMEWLHTLEVVPTIVSLREKFEAIRRAELERTLKELEDLTPAQRDAVSALSTALVNKLLHPPMAELKRQAAARNGHEYTAALRALFRLGTPPGG